ncbi:hypothetical protein BBJ28_00016583, partial [Nothophytophthora sp. Chile5]
VALVPGSAFGVKNGLRISYASSMETIEHALDGLEQSLSALTFALCNKLQYFRPPSVNFNSTMVAELKIAYEGEMAERAAHHFVGGAASAVGYKRAEDVCVAVKHEDADFAVLPIESSTLGSIHVNYDLLLKYGLHIVGEYDLQAKSGDEAEPTAYTRFLLLSKKEDLALDDKEVGVEFKTSLVFGFKDSTAKGMLNRALTVFSQRELDLTKIESRPWDGQAPQQNGETSVDTRKYKYLFYVDVQGHFTDENVVGALRRLSEMCAFVRILGSYSTSQSDEAITAAKLATKTGRLETGTNITMADKYPLNPMFQKVTVAKTVLIHGQTKQMEAEGKQVWSLCVGEPDYNPHERVLAAGAQAMTQGKIKYAHMKGMVELRALISKYLEQMKGLKYDPATEVLVSNGAQQSVYQALYAVCKPGQKVLIPTPYWLNYPEIVKLVYAEPVVLRTTLEESYLINPVELEKTLTANPETKAIILCNPSNPAGTLHSPEHLEKLAAVLRKPQFRHVVVVSDEIYEQLLYQDEGVPERKHVSFATLPGMYERTLLVNGFSKAHAMTGMRVGYLAAPKYFIDPCTLLQAQLTSCTNTVGQIAAVEALTYELECADRGERRITAVMKNLDEKRRYIVKRLTDMPNVRFAYPTSAFYVFLDLSSYFKGKVAFTANKSETLASVDDFCAHLLRESHIAVVPGSEFGDVYGMRISYASSMEAIQHAMDGMENLLKSLTFDADCDTEVVEEVVEAVVDFPDEVLVELGQGVVDVLAEPVDVPTVLVDDVELVELGHGVVDTEGDDLVEAPDVLPDEVLLSELGHGVTEEEVDTFVEVLELLDVLPDDAEVLELGHGVVDAEVDALTEVADVLPDAVLLPELGHGVDTEVDDLVEVPDEFPDGVLLPELGHGVVDTEVDDLVEVPAFLPDEVLLSELGHGVTEEAVDTFVEVLEVPDVLLDDVVLLELGHGVVDTEGDDEDDVPDELLDVLPVLLELGHGVVDVVDVVLTEVDDLVEVPDVLPDAVLVSELGHGVTKEDADAFIEVLEVLDVLPVLLELGQGVEAEVDDLVEVPDVVSDVVSLPELGHGVVDVEVDTVEVPAVFPDEVLLELGHGVVAAEVDVSVEVLVLPEVVPDEVFELGHGVEVLVEAPDDLSVAAVVLPELGQGVVDADVDVLIELTELPVDAPVETESSLGHGASDEASSALFPVEEVADGVPLLGQGVSTETSPPLLPVVVSVDGEALVAHGVAVVTTGVVVVGAVVAMVVCAV